MSDFAMTPKERRTLFGSWPERPRTTKAGHAAPPGTGPEGETCGSCQHIYRRQMSKTYIKCGLNRARWTGGTKTDIRAGDAACKFWEAS